MCSLLTVFTNKKFSAGFKTNADYLLQQSRVRGPDDSHSIALDDQAYLGSNRLQIIGSPGIGRMPMKSLNADCWIVLNGEIYNHKELRQELKSQGLRFATDSDTEVIVNAYIAWSSDFVKKLNGIFSFVIFDRDKSKIISARDRFGAKPLYYFVNNNILAFSSDFLTIRDIVMSLQPLNIRKESLTALMALRFVPGSATIYDGIFKVNPAEYIKIDLEEEVFSFKKQTYWTPSIQPQKFDQQEFNKKLMTAILRTSTADVSSGILLSGGLDSSAILAILKNERQDVYSTYSCAFEGAVESMKSSSNSTKITTDNIDETQLAAAVATQFNIENNSYRLQVDGKVEEFVSMQKAFGEPMASPNAFGLFQFGQKIRNQEAPKIYLSGTGADELLGGYQQLYFKDISTLMSVPLDQLLNAFSDFDSSSNRFNDFLHNDFIDESYLSQYLQNSMSVFDVKKQPEELLNQLAIFEFNFALPYWELDQADKLFMHYSFELRPAYLENDFVDYCFTIRSADKIDKKPLREAMRGILPSMIVERAKIPSLSTPSNIVESQWFQALLLDLRNEPCFFWNKEKLIQFLNQPKDEQSFDMLYRIVYVQSWFKYIHTINPFPLKIME